MISSHSPDVSGGNRSVATGMQQVRSGRDKRREASERPSCLQLRRHEGESIMGLLHPKTKITLNDSEVGVVGEQAVIARLTACGYVVLVPIGVQRYDLVIEDAEGKFWRIQCKVGRYHDKENAVIWNCYTVHKTRRLYTASEIDYYAVYFRDLEKVYLVPFNHAGTKVGYLRLAKKQDGRSWGNGREALFAENYEI
jgi:hypothetical protein